MFYVYLLASKPYGTLYIGTTSDLGRRVWEHKNKLVPGFTKRNQVERLVWFEAHESSAAALRREKQLKEWKRDWKSICLSVTIHIGWTSTQFFDSKCRTTMGTGLRRCGRKSRCGRKRKRALGSRRRGNDE
jgi:putative endonuclease